MAKRVKKTGRGATQAEQPTAPKLSTKTPVSVGSVVEVLQESLTESLCQEVYDDARTNERNRKWTLFTLARFWTAVVLEAPPTLTHALEIGRGFLSATHALFPKIETSNAAFFEKCKNFSATFFESLYHAFIDKILPQAPANFANEFAGLRNRFSNIFLIDASRIDRIAKRLKILRQEKAVVLPGCLTAIYDVFRGVAVRLTFSADAAESEFNRALPALESIPEGSLVVGDRLYCSGKLFHFLNQRGLYGLFRRTKAMKLTDVKRLSSRKEGGVEVEDWLVRNGSGEDALDLRCIRLKKNGKVYESVTSDLDPNHLSVDDAVNLYPLRWQVERLFFDLKVVLNLKKLYAANPNAVAMQIFSTAIVHAAFRVAQATIADEHRVTPEDLSPKKLFPFLAAAAITLLEHAFFFDQLREENPSLDLKKPRCSHPRTFTRLGAILVQRRRGARKAPEFDKERAKWKSLAHIDPKAFDLS